jgi:hypothetical protein
LRYGAVQVVSTPPAIPFNIETDSVSHVPSGTVIGSGNLQNNVGAGWHEVQVRTSGSQPVTLQPRTTYWLVMNGSSIPGGNDGYYEWYYISDSGGGYDSKYVAAMPAASWLLEPDLFSPNGINLLSVLFVKAVDVSLATKTYSSPNQVDMKINGTSIVGSTASVAPSKTFFKFTTNCSVTFMANWTARFENLQNSAVATSYIAYNALTFWNASFVSGVKPNSTTYPYTWTNRTLKVSPIPSNWSVPVPLSNITSIPTLGFNFTSGTGFFLIKQTDDVNGSTPWSASWLIRAQSAYAITVSGPPEAIEGSTFSLTISAPLAPSNITINVYNGSGSLANRTKLHIGSSILYSLKISKNGSYAITLFDTYDLGNEVSFATRGIIVIRALAAIDLASSTIDATWGDTITLGVRYRNATDGVNATFPSSPMPAFRIESVVATGVTPLLGGWYNFNYSTRNLPSAGNHSLIIYASYNGAYLNQTTFTLNLLKIPMTLGIVIGQTSVAAGSSLVVSAQLGYGNGTLVDNTFSLSFDFLITLMNGSVVTVTSSEPIYGGVATATLLATSDMKSINVKVTYAGTSTLGSANDSRLDILVTLPPPFPMMMVILAGGGTGAVIIGAIVAARVRSRRRLREEAKAIVLRQTASLARLIVVHLASGRSVFSRSLGTEEAVDPNLISGFLSANQSILQEVFQKKTGAGLRFADYGEYKVVSHLGNYVMATLFCTEAAGEELRSVLEQFSEKFEKKYSKTLEAWDGDMDAFKDADAVADEYFSLPLCSPYVVVGEDFTHRRLSGDERKVIEEAQRLSAGRGFFFITLIIDFLLTKQGMKRGKTVEVIRSLTNRGIFKQVTVDEAAELGRVQQEASTQP